MILHRMLTNSPQALRKSAVVSCSGQGWSKAAGCMAQASYNRYCNCWGVTSAALYLPCHLTDETNLTVVTYHLPIQGISLSSTTGGKIAHTTIMSGWVSLCSLQWSELGKHVLASSSLSLAHLTCTGCPLVSADRFKRQSACRGSSVVSANNLVKTTVAQGIMQSGTCSLEHSCP